MPTLSLVDSGIVTAQVSEDSGANWTEIPGVTNWSTTRTAADQREVRAFGGRTRSIAGTAGARTVTIEGIKPPLDPTWSRLEVLADQRAIVPQFRLVSERREVTGTGTQTAAVTQATGAVVFDGTGGVAAGDREDQWAPGMVMEIDGNSLPIKSVSAAGVVVLDVPASVGDIAAMAFAIAEPAAQRVVRGDITNVGQDSMSEGAELTDTITINASTVSPWARVTG